MTVISGLVAAAVDGFVIPFIANYSQGKQQAFVEPVHYVFFCAGGIGAAFHEAERHIGTLFRVMTDPSEEQRAALRRAQRERKRLDVYAFLERFADQEYDGEPFELRIPHLVLALICGVVLGALGVVVYVLLAFVSLPGVIFRGYARVLHSPEVYGLDRHSLRSKPWMGVAGLVGVIAWPVSMLILACLSPLFGLAEGFKAGWVVYYTSNPLWFGDEVLGRTRFTADEFDLPYPRAPNDESDTEEGLTSESDEAETPSEDEEDDDDEDGHSHSQSPTSKNNQESKQSDEEEEDSGAVKVEDLDAGDDERRRERLARRVQRRKRVRISPQEWKVSKQKAGVPLPRGVVAGLYDAFTDLEFYTSASMRAILDQPPGVPLQVLPGCAVLCTPSTRDDPLFWRSLIASLVWLLPALLIGLLFAVIETVLFFLPVLVRSYIRVLTDWRPRPPVCGCAKKGALAAWSRFLFVASPAFVVVLAILVVPHLLLAAFAILLCPPLLMVSAVHAAFSSPHAAFGAAFRGMMRQLRSWDRRVVRYVWDMSDERAPASCIWDGCMLEEDVVLAPSVRAQLELRARRGRTISRVRRWLAERGFSDEALVHRLHRVLFEGDTSLLNASDPLLFVLVRAARRRTDKGGLALSGPGASGTVLARRRHLMVGPAPAIRQQQRRSMPRMAVSTTTTTNNTTTENETSQMHEDDGTLPTLERKDTVDAWDPHRPGRIALAALMAMKTGGSANNSMQTSATDGAAAPELEEQQPSAEKEGTTDCCAACFGSWDRCVPGYRERQRRQEEREERREKLRQERRAAREERRRLREQRRIAREVRRRRQLKLEEESKENEQEATSNNTNQQPNSKTSSAESKLDDDDVQDQDQEHTLLAPHERNLAHNQPAPSKQQPSSSALSKAQLAALRARAGAGLVDHETPRKEAQFFGNSADIDDAASIDSEASAPNSPSSQGSSSVGSHTSSSSSSASSSGAAASSKKSTSSKKSSSSKKSTSSDNSGNNTPKASSDAAPLLPPSSSSQQEAPQRIPPPSTSTSTPETFFDANEQKAPASASPPSTIPEEESASNTTTTAPERDSTSPAKVPSSPPKRPARAPPKSPSQRRLDTSTTTHSSSGEQVPSRPAPARAPPSPQLKSAHDDAEDAINAALASVSSARKMRPPRTPRRRQEK